MRGETVRRALAAAVAMAALVPVVASAEATDTVSPRATGRYVARVDDRGAPHVPFSMNGVRVCPAGQTNCTDLDPQVDASGEFFAVDLEAGQTWFVIPNITSGSKVVYGPPTIVTATTAGDDLGYLVVEWNRPIGRVEVDLSLIDPYRDPFVKRFARFCPRHVPATPMCAGGTTVSLGSNGRETIRVTPRLWNIVTGYRRDSDLYPDSGLSVATLTNRPVTLRVRDGDVLPLTDSIRQRRFGELSATVTVNAPSGFFTGAPNAVIVISLCKGGRACGAEARIGVSSAGTATYSIPVAAGRWRMRARLTDLCGLVKDPAPSSVVRVSRNQTVPVSFSFDVAAMRAREGDDC